MARFKYMAQGDPGAETSLFRYSRNNCKAWYFRRGEWVADPSLLAYVQDDPLGADDVTLAEAKAIVVRFGNSADLVT